MFRKYFAVYVRDGKRMKTELHSVTALARRIGRSAEAVRQWEKVGAIPKALFRDGNGRRLYTKEQIEAVYRCAKACDIRQGQSLFDTQFPQMIWEAWGALEKKYCGVQDAEVFYTK